MKYEYHLTVKTNIFCVV